MLIALLSYRSLRVARVRGRLSNLPGKPSQLLPRARRQLPLRQRFPFPGCQKQLQRLSWCASSNSLAD